MKKNVDLLFHEFLGFLSEWKSGANPNKEQYFAKKVYHCMWEHFFDGFLSGICPAAIQASLEYEKIKILNSRITDDEILETVLLEKLLYSFYLGDYVQIAELTQNVTSGQFQAEHAVVLEKLWESVHNENLGYTSKKVNLMAGIDIPSENLKDARLKACFLDIRMAVRCFMELKKIALIRHMLQEEIPREAVGKLTDTDYKYLDIVSQFIDETDVVIYQQLFLKGCTESASAFDKKTVYDNLNFAESQILQILKTYFEAE